MGHYNRGDRLLSVARRHRVVVVVVVGGGDFGRVRFARYQYLLPGPVVFVVWWPMINSCWLRLLLPGLRKRPTNNVRAAANHDRQHEIKRARGIRDTMTLGDSRQTHMTEWEEKREEIASYFPRHYVTFWWFWSRLQLGRCQWTLGINMEVVLLMMQ